MSSALSQKHNPQPVPLQPKLFSMQLLPWVGAGLLLGISPLMRAQSAWGQAIAPAPDGTGTVVLQTGSNTDSFDISGGSLSNNGQNLFHSFERFGLGLDQTANFVAAPEIRNILGRITGGEASFINGQVQVGNGTANLVLINPAGILTGVNGRIEVPGSFTATTADGLGFGGQWLNLLEAGAFIPQDAALDGFSFSASAPGASGTILNEGQIRVGHGQQLRLIGSTVINTGELSAPQGEITLLSVLGQQRVSLGENGAIALGPAANGPAPLLTLAPLSELVAARSPNPINQASQITVNEAGEVQLLGQVLPTDAGVAIASGDLYVSASAAGEVGGRVAVLGDRVGLLAAQINASGTAGGGEVLIGGDYQGQGAILGTVPNAQQTAIDSSSGINADALTTGNGGRVIAWADDTTTFAGQISARGGSSAGKGGFVEVSGKQELIFRGQADVAAPQGIAGTLLLDPERIRIVNGSGGSNDAALGGGGIFRSEGGNATFTISETALEGLSGNVVLEATREIEIEELTTDGTLNLSNVDSITFDVAGSLISDFTMADRSNAIVTQGGDVTINVDGEIAAGTIVTNGGDITLDAGFEINLTENLSLISNGGDIAIDGDIEGTFSDSGSLLLNAGTGGDVDLNGQIGRDSNSTTVENVTILANNIDLGDFSNRQGIYADGSITISAQGILDAAPNQEIVAGQNLALIGTNVNLDGSSLFPSRLSADSVLTVQAAEQLSIEGSSQINSGDTLTITANDLAFTSSFSNIWSADQTLNLTIDEDINLNDVELQAGQVANVRSLNGNITGTRFNLEAVALPNDLNLEAAQDITLTQSDIAVGQDLTLTAGNNVSLLDGENPMALVAGRDLKIQGNDAITVNAFRDPASQLEAGRDLRLQSDGPIQINALLESGAGGSGNLTVERVSDANPADFINSSPSFATLLRANGDVTFGDYEGSSLKIVATGNINGGNIEIVGSNPSLTGPDPDLLLLQNQEAVILQAGADSPGGTVNLPPDQAIGGTNAVTSPTPSAAGSLTVGNISDVEGPVRLEATGAILTGDIETRETFGGVSPSSPILLTSTEGSITTGDLFAVRSNIQLQAAGDITVNATSNGGLDSGLVRTTLSSSAGGVQFDTIDAGSEGLYIDAATFVRGLGSRTGVGISSDLVNDPGLIDHLVEQGFDRATVEAADVTLSAAASEPRFSIVMRPAGPNGDGLTAPVFIRYGDRSQTLVDSNYNIEGNPSRVLIEGDSQQAFRLGPAFDGQPTYVPADPADSLDSYDPVTNNFDFAIAEGRQLAFGTDEFPTEASGLAAGIVVGEGTNGAFYASLQDQLFDPATPIEGDLGGGTSGGGGTVGGGGTTGGGGGTDSGVNSGVNNGDGSVATADSTTIASVQRRSGIEPTEDREVCEAPLAEVTTVEPELEPSVEAEARGLADSESPCAPASQGEASEVLLLRNVASPELPPELQMPEFTEEATSRADREDTGSEKRQ